MDADTPDLRLMRQLADEHAAYLAVDETHALGIFGPQGRGILANLDVIPDVLLGAFGKSFGLQGGFVAGAPELRNWLWNAARSFVFSTGISPFLAEAATHRISIVANADPERERVHALAALLRDGLAQQGARLGGYGPIVPWHLGPTSRATALANAYADHGFHVHAMRPPTVPIDTSRLRISVTARHTEAHIAAFLETTRRILASEHS
jgi:8-amino-7-oxononanoate synthase